MAKLKKGGLFAFLVLIITIFCYFRLKPIINQTVPYTYDQGRDFLKAQEIVTQKHLTFIGPTTGIEGVFHGAWWYYFLSMAYLIFNGWPSGYYYWLFFYSLLSVLSFALFIKKDFGEVFALLFLLMVSISPYFIVTAFFPGNNMLTPSFILLYIFALYRLLMTERREYIFILGLALGLVFETEVSFGLFLFPTFIVSVLFFKQLRLLGKNYKNLLFFFLGAILPFIPRILFELKNKFLQTRSFLNFFVHPTATNALSLKGSFDYRLQAFINYFKNVFYNNSSLLAFLGLLVVMAPLLLLIHKKNFQKQYGLLKFFVLHILILFFLSLAQKNNFFWGNYFEGIQYFFLFIIILSLNLLAKAKFKFVPHIAIALFLILSLYSLIFNVFNTSKIQLSGLALTDSLVQRVYHQVGHKNFCVRIYTPPVIPFTYNYLFSYYSHQKKMAPPSTNFVNNQCWYIIEKDVYTFRIDKWRTENIPPKVLLLKKELVGDNITLELYKKL